MRSIGKIWLRKVHAMLDVAKDEHGIVNFEQKFEYLQENLPDEIWDTWEGAYNELHSICWDYEGKQ